MSPARAGPKHHPEARMGLIRLILTKIHLSKRFGPPHGGPERVEGPKIGFYPPSRWFSAPPLDMVLS